jgi:serine/threonine-protein kinase
MSLDDTAWDSPPADPFALPRVPGFEVLARIAEGGLRIVYRARRLADGEVVALSISRDWGGPPEGDPRWRAARLQANLRHPHVERVFEEWQSEGRHHQVSEYLERGDLQDRLRDGPLPPREAAALLATVARAVHHLHLCGVLHRNLKSRNVLFAADGSVRVGGFALAVGKTDRDAGLSQGAILGTPAYMPPEQAQGGRIGPPADVHSLGAVLYECLTGLPPFQRVTPIDTIFAVLNDPAPELPPAVPERLRAICRRCLRKEPQDRYPTAEALAEDLERYLAAG